MLSFFEVCHASLTIFLAVSPLLWFEFVPILDYQALKRARERFQACERTPIAVGQNPPCARDPSSSRYPNQGF